MPLCHVISVKSPTSQTLVWFRNIIQYRWYISITSLATWGCDNIFDIVISEQILRPMSISYELTLRRMPQNTFDDKSTLVQAWCCRTSHCLTLTHKTRIIIHWSYCKPLQSSRWSLTKILKVRICLWYQKQFCQSFMMTSWHENALRITGLFWMNPSVTGFSFQMAHNA